MAQATFSLDLAQLRSRIASMPRVTTDHVGQEYPFIVRGDGNVLDTPVVSKSTGRISAKKVYNTNLLNTVAAEYHQGLLKEAAKLEALGQPEAASEKLVEFLNKATLSFSVLEGQSAFDGLANGSPCRGVIELREGKNAKGEDFRILTINGASVKGPKAAEVRMDSSAFLDNLLGSSESVPPKPKPKFGAKPTALKTFTDDSGEVFVGTAQQFIDAGMSAEDVADLPAAPAGSVPVGF